VKAALHLFNLTIEPAPDGQSVSLEQDLGGHRHRVSLHVSQVRALADLMDLDAGERERLRRALLRSWEMATHLNRALRVTADLGHEDLDFEVGRAIELVDFLAFICADFDDQYGPLPQVQEPVEPSKNSIGNLFTGGSKQ